MLKIKRTSYKNFEVLEGGESIFQASKTTRLAQFLNEERPEEVEAHIYNGNAIEIDLEEKEFFENTLFLQFREEHALPYED